MKIASVVVAFLVFAATPAFANEDIVNMALDRAHNLGFNGCDKEIKDEFSRNEFQDSVYVGAQVPFHSDFGDGLKIPNDELMLITNVGSDGLRSKLFRKFNNKCMVSGETLSVPLRISCDQYHYGHAKSVSATANMKWMQNVDPDPYFNTQFEKQGAKLVLINLPNGGNFCWEVSY